MATSGINRAPIHPRCNHSKLAGMRRRLAHWRFCELPPGHEGPHRCMRCQAAFGVAPCCVTMLTLSSYPLCYSLGLETFLSLNSEGVPHGTSYCRI